MGTRSTPGGNLQTRSPGGRKGCVWGLEARQGQEDRRSGRGRCPRLSPASGGAPGSASHRRLTSLPSGWPGPRRAPTFEDLVSVADPPATASGPPLCIGIPGSLPSETLDPDRPPRLPPAAFTCSGSGRRASRPGPRRRGRDAGPRVRSPFPPLRSPARRWAGKQRRPPVGGGGGERSARAGQRNTAALRPAREEQTYSGQPR